MTSNDDLLVSWKDIAAYLKCSVRKAQRLERLKLPVHRVEGAKSVWASRKEVDRWLAAQSGMAISAQPSETRADSVEAPIGSAEAHSEKPVRRGSWIVFAAVLILTIVFARASAYGAAMVSFGIGSALLVPMRSGLKCATWSRVLVAVFMILGMAYCASASTLPQVLSSVINMKTLKPALVYPVVTGLRFIPTLILISLFLAFVPSGSFEKSPRYRRRYLSVGAALLLAAGYGAWRASGLFRVWQAGLPIFWTLLAGEIFILALNLGLLAVGYRFFSATTHKNDYLRLWERCGAAYVLIALTAGILGAHRNEINDYHLDIRNPGEFRAADSHAAEDLKSWVRDNPSKIGPDLRELSENPQFLRALETGHFYKVAFDEAYQVRHEAVVWGYRIGRETGERGPAFVLVRFPAELAALLRFEPVQS